MNASIKQQVKDTLLEQAKAQYAASQANVGSEHDAAELDQTTSYDVDDQSQSDEAGDLTGIFEEVTAKQEAAIAAIEALDVSAKETVEAGAIVEFDGGHYLVGVVAEPFEVDGVTYEGLSTDSPIGEAIAGKRAGDTFTFRDAAHTLDSVI